ncbi:MAG: ABC transporter permease [Oscillospiraceae bacterium]|jgi:hypothetical protein|nr:ABC transporter permease [Oscillospiraceae bacterium]
MKLSKRVVIIIIINAVLLIALGVLTLTYNGIRGTLLSQSEAKRFAGQSGFAFGQVTSLFNDGNGVTINTIESWRREADDTLEKQSVTPLTPSAPLYLDAFSANAGTLSFEGLRGTAKANVIAVGGAFFDFHPYQLLTGGYIKENDLTRDRIVIDEAAAWIMFGSNDVAGMHVTVAGKTYTVAGVIRREQDSYSKDAYELTLDPNNCLIFMPYEYFDEDQNTFKFTSYEFVTRNLFNVYVYAMVVNTSVIEPDRIIDVNRRFDLWTIISDVLGKYGKRGIQTEPAVFPYWENAAVMAENDLAILALFMIICAVPPIVFFVILLGWLLKQTKGKGALVADKFGDLLDVYRRRRYKRQQEELLAAEEEPEDDGFDEYGDDEPEPKSYDEPE